MKNLKLSLLILIMCFMTAGYVLAESTIHIPALKIRAAVIIDSGVSDQSFATGEDFFEYMHDNRFLLAGNTYADMNFSFYNPRGNQDSITYWRLSTDQISSKILEQYDVLLMPLRNMNSYSGKMKEIIGDWIQKGGVLWIDNYSYTGKLGFLPIYDFVSAETLSGGVTQNENSALRNYPFDNYHITETNESRCLRLFNFDGMYHYANPLEYVDNKYNIATGIINLGAGKLIYSNGITGDRNNVYKCANLLFDAFAPNSNTSYARRPALLGNSLNTTEEYYGDKPLVADGHTYYINDKKLFVDGVDLTAHGTGVKPGSNSLSCPAKMGDGDIVVYDSEGCLYLCSGIRFNDDGTLSSSDVTWFKLYDADKSCYNSVKFSPLVYNYWVYFADDNGNLHLVYTKDLDGGEAKYTWVTRAGLTDNAMLKSAPCIYSRTDMYGSYVTEVAWIIVNDASADTLTYMLCSVPVAVVGEECYRQPQNVEPMGQMIANYVGFPNLTGNNTFRFYGSQLTDPDKVFTNVLAFGNDNSYTLAPYTKDTKSKWDYKINYNASGTGRLGSIQFNTEKRDGEYYFNKNSEMGADSGKNTPVREFKYRISYIPQYTNALRSALNFGQGMKDQQYLQYSEDGYVYQVKQTNDSDGSSVMNYISKYSFTENRRQGTHQRYQAWSYLPHAGFQNTMSPLSEDKALNIYSYIDWGFPSYAGTTAGAQIYVNGIKSYNGKVYVSLTADMGMWTRSAVVCLNSSAVPEIRIVDADRNTVNLRYNQISKNGFSREVGYTVKLYQPSVYDTEIPYSARVFNAPSTDLTEGLIKVNNMQNFQNNGHSQMITSSLPVFVQLSYDLDQTASNVKSFYLPIYPETCGTLDIDAYNREVGTVLFPLTAGDGTNVNKRLYADLSNWNQVEWYCVLPGNTEIFGEPVCSGDTVTLIGYEKDEFGKIQQNRLFSVVPKIADGGKVREDSIKVSALPLDMSVRDGLRTSFGVNKLTVSSQNQISVLENSKTLVIDNNSLVELDGSGNLAWRLNKVEYNDGGENNFDFTLENPVRARYVFDNNHIAVADAGTKTIFVMDKNGKLKSQTVGLDNGQWWMFNSFTDPFGLLRSGGSTDLGFMSDFVFWTETKGNTTLNHFLVADTTNKRVLDLVIETDENGDIAGNDFYDGNVLPYLNWVSYDIIPGNKNNFVSVDITEKLKDADGNEMRAVVCGIANYNASDRNGVKRAKGGSVVIYDYRMDTENFADTDEDAYLKRFGRIYDSIGKNGDNIFGNNTDSTVPSFSGVKKVIIANFDGRNFDPDDIQEYSDLELVVCDDMGVCGYTIENKNKVNGITYYYWKYNSDRLIPADYFGLNDPLYDVNIVAFGNDLVPGRFRPFSSNYYNRVYNGDTALRTSYAPLKVPIVPMDAKILPNGNILVLNGYSGKVTYNYKNPYDNLVYDIEADYRGEAIEFTFGTASGFDYPEIVWTSNQLKSYCIDDYVTVGNYTEEELSDWNRILDNLDGKVYSPDSSPINYDNNIIGGFSYMNKPLRVPKSLDR